MNTFFLQLVTTGLLVVQSWFAISFQSVTTKPVPSGVVWATTTASVTNVIDGDTIDVALPDGTSARVRYIGIDTPEMYPTLECGGKEATDRNQTLVAGRTVTLVPGPGPYDRYGRRLAYVYVDATFVNETLVQEGVASLMMISPNTAYRQPFEILQTTARSKSVGLWSCPRRSGG